MSKHYQKVKKYYDSNQWTIQQVRNAVIKDWITESEFYEITGKEY